MSLAHALNFEPISALHRTHAATSLRGPVNRIAGSGRCARVVELDGAALPQAGPAGHGQWRGWRSQNVPDLQRVVNLMQRLNPLQCSYVKSIQIDLDRRPNYVMFRQEGPFQRLLTNALSTRPSWKDGLTHAGGPTG